MQIRPALIAIAISLAAASVAWCAPPTPEQVDFFEKKIRPVLATHCYECHSEENAESELRVDSLAELLAGGTRGPAIIPGKAAESLLIRAVGHGETLQMPQKKKLPAGVIVDLTEWVKQGAPWPGEDLAAGAKPPATGTTSSSGTTVFTPEQKNHWAFQPVVDSPLPTANNVIETQSGLDRFILASLEQAKLGFSPGVDRRTLLRRASFDLTGLPPTPEEVRAFLADDAPDAFAKVIDRLLASPRYGEKYARHWLDLARYADSNGLDENLAYANAFRYRDYVIAAFNKDKPYDRFVQEQIAGDLLPVTTPDQQLEGIAATGFLCIGAKMLAEDDPVKMQMDIIDEQVDTLGKAFWGLTLGCARCHDHKFDPLPTRDYYSLAGIFKSTKTMENHGVVAVWQERPLADAAAIALRDEHRQRMDAKRNEINSIVSQATDAILSQERKRAGDYLRAAGKLLRQQELLAGAPSYGKLPPAEQNAVAGLKLLEAEDYTRGNVDKYTTGYGEGIGVLVNRGEAPNFAEYDLEVEREGAYQVEIRYAAAAARPCKLLVNGKLGIDGVAGKVTGSWNPDTQTWFVEGFVELAAGKNTLRLEHPQFFPHIDKLLIAPLAANKTAFTDKSPDHGPLNHEFVSQWVKYLEKTRSEADSVFSPWHAVISGQGLATDAGELPKKVASLLGNPLPMSASELADRYEKLFAKAEAAWQQLRGTAEGKTATSLPDPVQEALRQVLYSAEGPFAPPKEIETLFAEPTRQSLKTLREEQTALDAALPKLPEAMAVSDSKPENLRIHYRGSHLTLGDESPRQFPLILAGESRAPIAGSGSGRLELAEWMTRGEHPLTARVMVNRLWQWHFGEGLVRSSDNFGLLGDKPTHPELLDWLARRFVDDGWSVKKMHRRLMLSTTYQMSTGWNESAAAADPQNKLLWRYNRRRLSAEEIRDSLLDVSDALDCQMNGSQLGIENRKYVTSTANVDPVVYTGNRRSVYLPVVRSALYDVFQAFDFADPSVGNGKRDSTTVAPQSLFMMNSKIVSQQTQELSRQLLADTGLDDAGRVRTLYERAYCRPPTTAETQRALAFLSRYSALAVAQGTSATEVNAKAWQGLCRAILAANEFVYVE